MILTGTGREPSEDPYYRRDLQREPGRQAI